MRLPFRRRCNRARSSIAVRGFQAAATDRLLAGWRSDIGFTPSEIAAHLETLRSRCRQMAKDAPAFKRWLELSAINIVGEGFALKSTPHDGTPGTPQYRLDESAARFIEWHWWRFCNYRDPMTGLTWCDASGRKTDAELDRLNVKAWRRDGEYFIYVVRTAANPYGIAWRVIRPDYCDHTYNVEALPNGNLIHCGVEMEASTRRPVAYYFQTPPRNAYVWSARGTPLIRIPADQIIHGFTQEDEDQPRGIPQGHAGLVKLKMLEELDRAELTAAREDACTTRSYEADRDASMDPFKDLTLDENNTAAQALIAEKEPGQQVILPPGWREKVNTPQHPNGNHGVFKSTLNKDVASAFGIEYSNAFNDWAGVSFSSVRVGTISERDAWIVAQNDMISRCKTPQFLAWLRSFLSLDVSGGLKLVKFDKFVEHEFRGRRWMWVDPMKDMAAAVVAVDRKWKTNAQVAGDMGTDFGDNVEGSRREQEMLAGDTKEAVPTLNGAQITAALEITESYASGEIGKEAAVALLTAAGVPQDAAVNMIAKQQVKEPDDEE
ncbi:MAG: phage portal protein [Verrucomicrobia bacterium]|nr:phage portal protein [Verrucomicrobiota bacterium]